MNFCEFLNGLFVVFDACFKKLAVLVVRGCLAILPDVFSGPIKQTAFELLDNRICCYIFVAVFFSMIDFVFIQVKAKINKTQNEKEMTKPTPDMTAIPFGTSVLYFCRDNKIIYQSIVEKEKVHGIVAQMRGFGHKVYAGDQIFPEAVYYYGLPTGGFRVTVHLVSALQWNLKAGRVNNLCEFVVREKGLKEADIREMLDARRKTLDQVESWDYDIVPVPDGTRADFTLGNMFSAVCFSDIK